MPLLSSLFSFWLSFLSLFGLFVHGFLHDDETTKMIESVLRCVFVAGMLGGSGNSDDDESVVVVCAFFYSGSVDVRTSTDCSCCCCCCWLLLVAVGCCCWLLLLLLLLLLLSNACSIPLPAVVSLSSWRTWKLVFCWCCVILVAVVVLLFTTVWSSVCWFVVVHGIVLF